MSEAKANTTESLLKEIELPYFKILLRDKNIEEVVLSETIVNEFLLTEKNTDIEHFKTRILKSIDSKSINTTKTLKLEITEATGNNRICNFKILKDSESPENIFYAVLKQTSIKSDDEISDLVSQEQFVKATVDKMPAVFYAKSREGRFLMVNEVFRSLFSMSDEQILGKSNHEVFPKETADQFRENDLQIIRESKVIESQEDAVGSDGRRHYYQSYKFPYFDEKGEVYATGGISLDITPLKESQERLNSSLQILEMNNLFLDLANNDVSLQEKANAALDILCSQDWIDSSFGIGIYYLNKENTLDLLTGKNLPKSFEDIDSLQVKYKICLEKPTKSEFDFFEKNSDPSGKLPTHYCLPIHGRDKMIGSIFICMADNYVKEEKHEQYLRAFSRALLDLASKNQTKRELERQKRIMLHNAKLASIGELAAGIGHEINNPLAILRGYIETLEKRYKETGGFEEEEFSKYLLKLNKASERIAAIVQSLRTFSRADTDDIEEFDVLDALNESVAMISEIFKRDGIKIQFSNNTNKSNIACIGNRGRMQQVFMNLFANARDATENEEDRLIKIEVNESENNKSIHISVEDNGEGIKKHIKDKIFDPFFTTKEVNKGTGIGLSLVHNIISEHKGEVSVENTKTGCRFLIELPLLVKG